MKITTEGDLFKILSMYKCDYRVIIPHVCNNVGAWGAGFSGALSNYYPQAEEAFRQSSFPLGLAQIISVEENVVVANMFAQDGVGGATRHLNYGALASCMNIVGSFAKNINDTGYDPLILCPEFGAGLAGGDPVVIQELKDFLWQHYNVITVRYCK